MRSQITINEIAYDEILVNDVDGDRIEGLTKSDFSIYLYNPSNSEVSSSIIVSLTELGEGLYRMSFTPNQLGSWVLLVIHDTYFPYGQSASYDCVSAAEGSIGDMVTRILGLCQENYRIFNPQYDNKMNLISGIIKIYSQAADVDTDTNPLATYQVDSTFDKKRRLTGYKVKKI